MTSLALRPRNAVIVKTSNSKSGLRLVQKHNSKYVKLYAATVRNTNVKLTQNLKLNPLM